MQEHPVPQNITGFEFKLVGFLTLKQFLYLAGVGILCFVIFVSAASFIKWLFITPLVLIGLALAFFPINGMSFDRWVVVFIQAITSPARRIWYKKPKIISFLAPEFSYYLRRAPASIKAATSDRTRLQSFLSQIRAEKKTNTLDSLEQTRLSTLDFGQVDKPDFTPTTPVGFPDQSQEPKGQPVSAENSGTKETAEKISDNPPAEKGEE